MKKIILFLFVLPIFAVGQTNNDQINIEDPKCLLKYNPLIGVHKNIDLGTIVIAPKEKPQLIITDRTIKEYIDWCKLDSNKIIIGYDFIFEEHMGSLSGWSSGVTVYDSKYAPKDKNYIKYYIVNFKKPDEVYYLWCKQQQRDIPQYYENKDYIRAEPITKELEPTFIGFYEWLKEKDKNND